MIRLPALIDSDSSQSHTLTHARAHATLAKIDPSVFLALQCTDVHTLSTCSYDQLRPVLTCLVRMCLIAPLDQSKLCAKKRHTLLALLSEYDAVNSLVALISLDFGKLRADLKATRCDKQKGLEPHVLDDGLATNFERNSPMQKMALVLSILLVCMSPADTRASDGSMEVIDNCIYLQEIADIICVASAELPDIFAPELVCEGLMRLSHYHCHLLICHLVANMPNSFDAVCESLVHSVACNTECTCSHTAVAAAGDNIACKTADEETHSDRVEAAAWDPLDAVDHEHAVCMRCARANTLQALYSMCPSRACHIVSQSTGPMMPMQAHLHLSATASHTAIVAASANQIGSDIQISLRLLACLANSRCHDDDNGRREKCVYALLVSLSEMLSCDHTNGALFNLVRQSQRRKSRAARATLHALRFRLVNCLQLSVISTDMTSHTPGDATSRHAARLTLTTLCIRVYASLCVQTGLKLGEHEIDLFVQRVTETAVVWPVALRALNESSARTGSNCGNLRFKYMRFVSVAVCALFVMFSSSSTTSSTAPAFCSATSAQTSHLGQDEHLFVLIGEWLRSLVQKFLLTSNGISSIPISATTSSDDPRDDISQLMNRNNVAQLLIIISLHLQTNNTSALTQLVLDMLCLGRHHLSNTANAGSTHLSTASTISSNSYQLRLSTVSRLRTLFVTHVLGSLGLTHSTPAEDTLPELSEDNVPPPLDSISNDENDRTGKLIDDQSPQVSIVYKRLLSTPIRQNFSAHMNNSTLSVLHCLLSSHHAHQQQQSVRPAPTALHHGPLSSSGISAPAITVHDLHAIGRWIVHQMCDSVAPVHATLISLLHVYVTHATDIESTAGFSCHPQSAVFLLSDEQTYDVFYTCRYHVAGRLFLLYYLLQLLSAPDTDDASAGFLVGINEAGCLGAARSVQKQVRTQLSHVPICRLLHEAQQNLQSYGQLFPCTLSLVVRKLPHICVMMMVSLCSSHSTYSDEQAALTDSSTIRKRMLCDLKTHGLRSRTFYYMSLDDEILRALFEGLPTTCLQIRCFLQSLLDMTHSHRLDSCIESHENLHRVIHTLVRYAHCLLRDGVSLYTQNLYMCLWYRFSTMSTWSAMVQSLQRSSVFTLPITDTDLIMDPLLVLRCDPHVFHSLPFMHILIDLLNIYLSASRNHIMSRSHPTQNAQHLSDMRKISSSAIGPGTHMTDSKQVVGCSAGDLEKLKMALVSAQHSAAIQMLIEICIPFDDTHQATMGRSEFVEVKDSNEIIEDGNIEMKSHHDDGEEVVKRCVLNDIRALVCSQIHQTFIETPTLAKLVHFQGYPLTALEFMVSGVPSMHICLDFLPELIAHVDESKQIFAIHLLAHLAKQFPIPRSLSICRLALSVCNTQLTAVIAGDRRPKFLLLLLEPFVSMCATFRVLADEIIAILVRAAVAIRSHMIALRSQNKLGEANKANLLLRRLEKAYLRIFTSLMMNGRVYGFDDDFCC